MTVTTEKKHDPDADEKLDAAEVDVEDTTEDTTEDSTEDTAEERPTGGDGRAACSSARLS
ncbi:MAG: hypothetical protein ACXWZI_12720 [Mycobacterium sp.]